MSEGDQRGEQSEGGVAPLASSATLFTPRRKALFAVLVVSLALVYFAYIAFRGAAVSYHSVAEAVALGATSGETTIGVKGKLVQGSYARSADGFVANFKLHDEDGTTSLPIRYAGEIGQVFFNEHSEVILQGAKSASGVFTAESLTVRCPSKYLTEQEKAELEAQDGQAPQAPPYQPGYFSEGT